MHLHGGYQPCVVRRLPGNPILDDQVLPNRINRRSIGQQRKHALQAHQFGRRLRDRQTQAVLRNRPRGDHLQLEKVLRNNVKVAAPAWQSLKGARNRFVLGMSNL